MRKIIIPIIAALLFCCGCQPHKITPSFYYWRDVYDISNEEQEVLSGLEIKKMYIHMFDIDWDEGLKTPVISHNMQFIDSLYGNIEVVPVVHVNEDVVYQMISLEMPGLAKLIADKLKVKCAEEKIKYTEVQVDCGWRKNSRENYFLLLKSLRKQCPNKLITCTIRPDDLRYHEPEFTPPVDRAMLHFFNTGYVQDNAIDNSIYDSSDATIYFDYIDRYNIPYDVTLPTYSWGVHFKENELQGLVNITKEEIVKDERFTHITENYYLVNSIFDYDGQNFEIGDYLRLEEVTPALCKKIARRLNPWFKGKDITVAFFRLDQYSAAKYKTAGYREILDEF